MAEISPKWALRIYAKLWVEFKGKSFSKEQANKVVRDGNLPQALSRLKRDGWLKIGLDVNDARKSLYTLKEPKEVIEYIGKK